MAKLITVRSEIAGDLRYQDARLAAYRDELVAATERGERGRCSTCGAVAVAFFYDDFGTPFDFFVAECDACPAQAATPC